MGVRDEALKMLKNERLSPLEIAKKQGVTLSTILSYLDQWIGRGKLRRSDILFSIPAKKRNVITTKLTDGRSQNLSAIMGRLKSSGVSINQEDVMVIQRYWDIRFALGEMYEDVRTIEIKLHNLIKQTLVEEFGSDESDWWREGIPKNIRKKCQDRREDEDFVPVLEAYCYTDLIDLREIIEKRWKVIRKYLPEKIVSDRKSLLNDLIRLNQIRRLVMHPVRGSRPSDDDFEFVYFLKERLGF